LLKILIDKNTIKCPIEKNAKNHNEIKTKEHGKRINKK